jgi:hypothetical protein
LPSASTEVLNFYASPSIATTGNPAFEATANPFSEKQLEKPPVHTNRMMKLFHMFGDSQKALFQQVKDYGLDITWKEFTDYTEPLLKKINELTADLFPSFIIAYMLQEENSGLKGTL